MTLLALNDENQATFGYGTGTPAAPVVDYEQFHWRTWQNGQLGSDQSLDCYTPASPVDGDPAFDFVDIYYLTGAGAGFGGACRLVAGSAGVYIDDEIETMFLTSRGRCELPDPPYENSGQQQSGVDAVSPHGVIVGEALVDIRGDADGGGGEVLPGYVSKDGGYLLFDAQGDYAHTTLPAGVAVVPSEWHPFPVNDQGWAIGWNAGYHATELWNGQGLQAVGAGLVPAATRISAHAPAGTSALRVLTRFCPKPIMTHCWPVTART